MKLYLCIFGILSALVLVSCEPPEEVKKMFQECAKELGLPEGPPNMDDPKVKCFFACVMKKKGNLVDGKVSVETAIESASKHFPGGTIDSLKADITECAKKANGAGDECAVGGAFHKCMLEKHPHP